jgi:Protein of unknown function (DUF4238)
VSPQRKRNHFIPRFLLNRFSSRREGKKHWIWQLNRSGPPKEVSTRDAAVSDYFYGGQETGVEDAFTNVEGRFGALLGALDRGEQPENHSEDLCLFVWTLAVRTRAVRGQMGEAVNDLFDQMATTITPDQVLAAVLEQFDLPFDRAIEDHLKEIPAQQRAAIQNVLSTPGVRQQLLLLGRDRVRSIDVGGIFQWILRELGNQNRAAAASEDGQIRGLSFPLESGEAPESFRPDYWCVHESSATDLVLGDGCVFATSQEGLVGSLLRFGQAWNALYLPISSSKLLVGGRSLASPVLSASEVNRTSAELSFSHIYARSASDAELSLVQRIGTAAPLISKEELASVVSKKGSGQIDAKKYA